jgi:hypothetical protein
MILTDLSLGGRDQLMGQLAEMEKNSWGTKTGMEGDTSEIEARCLEAMEKGEAKVVEMYLGPYLSHRPRTKNTGLIRAYMILYYLSLGLKKMAFFVLETVSDEELEDENIGIALEVERCVLTSSLKRLTQLRESIRDKAFLPFVDAIIERQTRAEAHPGSEAASEQAAEESMDKRNIADAIYIGKHTAHF